MYSKITFKGIRNKLKILPGDRVSINFGSGGTARIKTMVGPDISSKDLPEPFKSRY